MAFTLIGGTLGGTVLTLIFLPALYALWYRIKPDERPLPAEDGSSEIGSDTLRPLTA
jgi:hypothetical protein